MKVKVKPWLLFSNPCPLWALGWTAFQSQEIWAADSVEDMWAHSYGTAMQFLLFSLRAGVVMGQARHDHELSNTHWYWG